MKVRDELNNEVFNEITITELLDTLDKLKSCVECFIDPDLGGSNICGYFIKAHTLKMVNNPILKSIVYESKK